MIWTPPPLRERLIRPTRHAQRGWIMTPMWGARTDIFHAPLTADGNDTVSPTATLSESAIAPTTITYGASGAVLASNGDTTNNALLSYNYTPSVTAKMDRAEHAGKRFVISCDVAILGIGGTFGGPNVYTLLTYSVGTHNCSFAGRASGGVVTFYATYAAGGVTTVTSLSAATLSQTYNLRMVFSADGSTLDFMIDGAVVLSASPPTFTLGSALSCAEVGNPVPHADPIQFKDLRIWTEP